MENEDEVLDLLVLGFLRAQRSNGSNGNDGFPGIYQADVMLRRGAEATGVVCRWGTKTRSCRRIQLY